MITIEILTTSFGCAKCERTIKTIDELIGGYKGKIKVVKTDIVKHPGKLIEFSVMSTPAVIINGKLEFEGPPSKEKLKEKIEAALK